MEAIKICRICGKEYTNNTDFCDIPCIRKPFISKNKIDVKSSNKIAYMQVADLVIAIDYDDIPKLYDKKWHLDGSNNITNLYEGKRIYLARYIMNCPAGKYVLYKNGDKLDNRKINLLISDYKNGKGN